MMSSVLPFSNEVASVLTGSGYKKFSGLYQHFPKGKAAILSKTLIDLAALSGIVISSVQTAEKSGSKVGIVQGILVLVVAFVIPNLAFDALTKKFCGKCNSGKKLVFGLVLIGILYLVERYFVHGVAHSFAEEHETETHV